MNKSQTDKEKALAIILEATKGATKGCGIVESVRVLVSQRDNARFYVETFREKLKELGYKYV